MLQLRSSFVLTHCVEREWQSHLVLVNGGVQDTAGRPLRVCWKATQELPLVPLRMVSLTQLDPVEAITHRRPGPTSGIRACTTSEAHSLTASAVCWEEQSSPQRRSLRKNACLHSVLSSG